MEDDLDLNIDNYDLADLLHLFRMPYPFDVDDLRAAKKVVMRTHPDKSGLPKEYFLFFAKAFKLIHGLHGNSHRSKNTEYLLDDSAEEAALFKPFMESDDFNARFNELFEQHRVQQAQDEGHGDWLQSKEDVTGAVANNQTAMNEHIEERQRALCVRETVRSVGDEVMSNIDPDAPAHFSATLFSKLAYEDVRRAHTETVVPVSESDRPTFANEEELRDHRAQTATTPLDESAASRTLHDAKVREERADIQRAYRLAKQDQDVARAGAEWKSDFMRLAQS
jgi:hypothetical protein